MVEREFLEGVVVFREQDEFIGLRRQGSGFELLAVAFGLDDYLADEGAEFHGSAINSLCCPNIFFKTINLHPRRGYLRLAANKPTAAKTNQTNVDHHY